MATSFAVSLNFMSNLIKNIDTYRRSLNETSVKECSLYFHIPFCRRKCDYCHFYVIPFQKPFVDLYMESLAKEWEQKLPLLAGYSLVSIYFGGGTPSLLGPELIDTILSWIRPHFSLQNVEITLEANPENAHGADWKAWSQSGINRVSVGVQSLNNSLLKILSREHNAEQAIDSLFAIQAGGISNISIDLMYEIPTQTMRDWEETLEKISELPITHLSLYNLTFEPHTVFYKKRSRLQALLPSQETSLEMLKKAIITLPQIGLERYEISAFAKPGFYSRHNTGYWLGRPFLGLGPSAWSDWEQTRIRNTPNLNRYAKKLAENQLPEDEREKLAPEARQRELLAIGLRLIEGILLPPMLSSDLQKTFENLKKRGWLEQQGNRLKLTEEGLFFHDTVAEEIIADVC